MTVVLLLFLLTVVQITQSLSCICAMDDGKAFSLDMIETTSHGDYMRRW